MIDVQRALLCTLSYPYDVPGGSGPVLYYSESGKHDYIGRYATGCSTADKTQVRIWPRLELCDMPMKSPVMKENYSELPIRVYPRYLVGDACAAT